MGRLDAVLIAIEALEGEAEHLRGADHAVVGQALRQHDIARAQLPAQGLRHGPQAMVAAGMAMGIVDRLEPIEIDEQDR